MPLESMYDEYGAPRSLTPLQGGGHFVEFSSYYSGYLCTAAVRINETGMIISIKTGGQDGCVMWRY